jgi:hypothetical protein
MRRLPAKIRHLLQWVAVNFFYLVTPILLLIFVLWLHEAEKKPKPGQPPVSELEGIFNEIKVPSAHTPKYKKTFVDHGGDVGFYRTFDTILSPGEVVQYYKKNMTKNNWTEVQQKIGYGNVFLKFCKNHISFILDVSSFGEISSYYISVMWASDPGSYAFCE